MDCRRDLSRINCILAKRNLITHTRYHSYDSGVLSDVDMSRNTLSSADSEQSCCSALYSLPNSSGSSSRGCSTSGSSKAASHHSFPSPHYHGFSAAEDLRLSSLALPEVDKLPWTETEVLLCFQSGKFKNACDNLSIECLRKLSNLLQRPLQRITQEAKRLSSTYNKCSRHNIQSACQIILSPHMYSLCHTHASQAVSMYTTSNSTQNNSKSIRCSLRLSVGNHHRWLLDSSVAGYICELSAVYLCAVMETIIEQTVTLAISAKCLENDAVITTDILESGIQQSSHLYSLYEPYSQLLSGRNCNGVVISSVTCSTSQPGLDKASHNLATTCVSSNEELSDLMQRTCSCPAHGCKCPSWSHGAVDTLFYYMRCGSQTRHCNEYSIPHSQERWSRTLPPLLEWIRVGTAFTQHRRSTLIDSDDVRQAARVLLPNCDCPIRALRHFDLPSSNNNADPFELLQRELALSLLLNNKEDGSSQAISLLHKSGINKLDEQGLSPLMHACIHGCEVSVMKLLQAGADPTIRVPARKNPTCAGWTAQHFSVAIGNASITQVLLEYISDVDGDIDDLTNRHIETPLQIAASLGNLSVLDLLLRKHTDPFRRTHFSNVESSGTFTSITLAASHGHILALRRLFAGAVFGAGFSTISKQTTLTDILGCSVTKPLHSCNGQADTCHQEKHEFQKIYTENDYMVIEHEYMTIEEVFQTDSGFPRLEDRLPKEHVEILADALYSSSENGYIDICMEIHSTGVPWSLYTWYMTLNTAHKYHRKALMQSLLLDFHPAVYLSHRSPLLIHHCLPLMFEIFRESKNEMVSRQLSTIFTQLYGAQPLPALKDTYLHPRPLIDCNSYSNSQDHADISFVVNGKLFYAHKILLVGASQTFRSMLSSFTNVSMPQVEIADMDSTTFENVMKYLYGGVNELSSTLCQCGDHRPIKSLLAASHYFKLEGLKRKCEILLSKTVSLDNCLSVYKASKTYECTDLMEMCEEYFLHNLSTLLKSNDAFKRVLYSTKLHNRELLSRLLATLVNRLSGKCH